MNKTVNQKQEPGSATVAAGSGPERREGAQRSGYEKPALERDGKYTGVVGFSVPGGG